MQHSEKPSPTKTKQKGKAGKREKARGGVSSAKSPRRTLAEQNAFGAEAAGALELALQPNIKGGRGVEAGGVNEMKKRGSKTTHARERSLQLMKKREQELAHMSASAAASTAGGDIGSSGVVMPDVDDWSKPYLDESSGRYYVYSPSRDKTKWV